VNQEDKKKGVTDLIQQAIDELALIFIALIDHIELKKLNNNK
jgi:hypothetical protein